MSTRTLPTRLTALATVSALALATAPPAWPAPPPIAPRVDPPGRVGRLARITGTVSYHNTDADQWSPATLNFPVTTGDSYWTEPGARADIQIASNSITLAPSTELDIASLDDHALAASEPQGETYLNLRAVPAGNTYSIQTPRGVVQIAANGRYDIIAGDTDHPTLVTVVDGAAQITGTNLSLQIGPRQTASVTGTDTFGGSVGPISQDAFLTAMLAEGRPAPRASTPIPPIVQGMTGCEDLDSQGTWAETPQYGSVWYPPVQADWVPYRHGRWSYVAPWGWTWIDEAPWGFAPFHYGRWAQIDNRWGWVPVSPGGYADPVSGYPVPYYSPALVSFVDVGGAAVAGAAVGFAAGALAGRSVGWLPLGPREAYYPPYRTNVNYIRSVNATTIQNVNQTINTTTINNNRTVVQNFVNRGAATVVPASAMVQSRPIAAAAQALPQDQFTRAQAQFRAPVAPAAMTAGITPAVARQFNFVPPARPAQPVAGPAINPAVLRAAPGRPFPTPALRTNAAPGPAAPTVDPAARPNEPARAEGVPRPGGPGPESAPRAGVAAPELRPNAAPEPLSPRTAEPARGAAPAAREAAPVPAARPAAPAQTPVARPVTPASPRPAPAFRPQPAQPVVRQPPAAFHPPAQAARPPAQPAFRPQPTFRPQPVQRPAAPPPRAAAPPPRPAAPPPRPAAPARPAPGEHRRP